MKKMLFVSLLATLMLISFSCKKSDSTNTSTTTSFSAKVYGSTWTAATVTAVRLASVNSMTITALGSNPSETITMGFTASGTGTYTFSTEGNLAYVSIGGHSFMTITGGSTSNQVTITTFDVTNKRISGTFSFDGMDTNYIVYHVTDGSFQNVPMTIQ